MSGGPPISPACAALIKAFCPGEGAMLRSCASRDWTSATAEGERVTLEFDLPDDDARIRAHSLVRQADVLADVIALGGSQVIADITVWLNGSVLKVDALVVKA